MWGVNRASFPERDFTAGDPADGCFEGRYCICPFLPWPDARRLSQALTSGGLPCHKKGARKLPGAANLKGSEILVPVPIRHVRILCLPLSQFEQVFLRNPALPRAVSQVGPLLSWKPLPLDFRHSSTAQDQSSKLIHHSVLFLRIVLGKVLLQPLEELTLSIRLAFQAKAHESGDRLAHTSVNRLSVSFHLAGDRGRKTDAVPRSWRGPAVRFRYARTGLSVAFYRVCFRLRHIESVCRSMQHARNTRVPPCAKTPPHIEVDTCCAMRP